MRLLLAVLAAFSLSSGGCRWMAPESGLRAVDPDTLEATALRDEYHRLVEQAEKLQAAREQAEQELAGRTIQLEDQREANRLLRAELDATLDDLEYLETQFITLERSLGHEESKASAVAAVADVQLLQNKFRKQHPELLSGKEWAEVDRRLEAAEGAVASARFTAAVYHAHRAMRLLNHSEREHQSFLASGDPRVISVSAANYRKGPGTDFTVVGQLSRGTVVVEVSRSNEWVQVKTRDGKTGWIHVSLTR